MVRRISAYILFGLGFLTVTFFRKYSGTIIPYPFLFWLIGLLMFWGGWALLRWTPTIKEQQDTDRLKKLIDDIKTNGEKIKVDFSKCDIKQNNYVEEKEKYGTGSYITTLDIERDIQAWNALTDSTRNTERVQVNQAVLIFDNSHNDKTEKFISRVIPFDRVTLLFKLDKQKETTLYVDKNDRSKYYFDLEFLSA
jgi:hypothetical protein